LQQRGIGFLALVLGLVALSSLIATGIAERIPVIGDVFQSEPKMGLDVRGGFRFTLVGKKEDGSPVTDEEAAQVISNLEQRAQTALGVAEATVTRRGSDRFVVELPGFTDEAEARNVISVTARLEYYWARNVETELQRTRPYTHTKGYNIRLGLTVRDSQSGKEGVVVGLPSSSRIQVRIQEGGTEQIAEFPANQLSVVAPRDAKGDPKPGSDAVFSRKVGARQDILVPRTPEYEQMLSGWRLVTTGDKLTKATARSVGDGVFWLDLQFNAEGATELNKFAREVMNRKENLAAVLDGECISIAFLMDGVTFPTGEAVVQGNFNREEITRLVALLNAGRLSVDLSEENVTRISPVQGEEALDQIIFAGGVAFVLICLFLLVYYVFPGLVALLALVAYALFCYAVYVQLGVTFSLAGIGGFILSVSMAVDANILIFERLKEELRSGKSLLSSIDLGFKRAFPAILDSNACTMITCAILYHFGTGPVKGFATTLFIGVLISLFTAITVTRSLLFFFVNSGIGKNEKLYGLNRNWFGEKLEQASSEKPPWNIVGKMGRYFAISGLIILPGLIFLGLGGIKPNVEFLDGVESRVLLPKGSSTTPSELDKKLVAAGIRGVNVKVAPPDSRISPDQSIAFVTIPKDPNPEFKSLIDSGETEKMFEARKQVLDALGADTTPITREGSDQVIGLTGELGFESTSPAVRTETIYGAFYSIIAASILIVLYLAIRFGLTIGGVRYGFRFGISAILAMLHDVFVVVGLAAIMGYIANWEISSLTITALLTVIGFSVHDTIVIFDRIRENLRRPLAGETFDNLVNRSIMQSFARSINTSMTTIVTLALLVFIGSATPDLRHFYAAMLFGIISGTYSSIFNAAPILVIWERLVARRKGTEATIMHDERLRGGGEDEEDITVFKGEQKGPGDGESGPGYSPTRRSKR
jgi:SecD/SecF fusion protein